MDEQGWTPIVREPDVARLRAAAHSIADGYAELVAQAGRQPEVLAQLLAARALAADDAHAQRHGMVGVADRIGWAEVEALAERVAADLDPAAHAGPGTWHPNCPDCAALQAVARVRGRRRYRTVGPGDPALAERRRRGSTGR